jgi:hypothetical protein
MSVAGLTKREIVLAAAATVFLLAAALGFYLYGSSQVPQDAAAKVDESYITEKRVADWIAQYRAAYGLEDDADFAASLLSQNLNVGTFRQNTINQLALDDIVERRAGELGIDPADEQAQAQVDAMRQNMAFGDEGVWADTLSTYGLSEESLLVRYRTNLMCQAVLEADVARRLPTEDELLSYIQEYLAGTTQKHASRIVFSGEDALARAQDCSSRLTELKDAGSLDTTAFAELARELSDEADADTSGGAYAWSGSTVMDADVMDVLKYLEVGAFAGPQSVAADDALEIIYCDAYYTFAAQADIGSLTLADVPSSLLELIADAATEALWTSDTNAYLAGLLAAAKITYYPAPDDAAYAVSMTLVSS